eukprot:5081131-Amphidinium_carterae.1
MHQKTKLIQEAVASRDSLREELVEVYMPVRRLPKEELPLPIETPKIPDLSAALKSLWLDKGDKEAQSILENKELEEDLASALLQDVLDSGVIAANIAVEEEEEEPLELGVPAPGFPSWRGEAKTLWTLTKSGNASEDALRMEKMRSKSMRWCLPRARRG